MNNPFNDFENNNPEFAVTSKNIEIAKIEINEERAKGKKMQTVVKNWNLTKDELKNHKTIFAKKNGCRGTLKIKDGENIVSFSGEKKYEVRTYLIDKCNISEDDIIME